MAKNVLINEEYVWTHKGGILKIKSRWDCGIISNMYEMEYSI